MKSDGARKDSPFKTRARKYSVSEAQLLLKWGIQNGYPVLPKSINEERICQNINLFSFEIDYQDMASISNLDRGDGIAWTSGDPCRVA